LEPSSRIRFSGTIDWDDIESLLIAVGCKVIEGSGSRVRFDHNSHAVSIDLIPPRRPSDIRSGMLVNFSRKSE
jgi:hypothetical protein